MPLSSLLAPANYQLQLLTLTARTANVQADDVTSRELRGGHIIIEVTAVGGNGAGPSITPTIYANPSSAGDYPLLIGAAITTTGITVLKVYPGITPVANLAANDLLPYRWYLSMAHANAESITYRANFFGAV